MEFNLLLLISNQMRMMQIQNTLTCNSWLNQFIYEIRVRYQHFYNFSNPLICHDLSLKFHKVTHKKRKVDFITWVPKYFGIRTLFRKS